MTQRILRAGVLLCVCLMATGTALGVEAAAKPVPQEKTGETLQAQLAAGYLRTAQRHLAGGRLREAAADFRAALAIDPGLTAAREGLAQVNARLQEAGDAAPLPEPSPAAVPPQAPAPEAVQPPAASSEKTAERTAAAEATDDIIRAQAALLRTCAAGRQLLGERKFEEAAKEYEAALNAADLLARRTDVSNIQAEARHGLKLAREGLLAQTAASTAPAPEPRREAHTEPTAAETAPAAPPLPLPARPTPQVVEPRESITEVDATAEFDEAIRAVGQMMRPQTHILTRKSLPERMKDVARPREDVTSQRIGRQDFESTDDQEIAKEIQAKLLKRVSVNFKEEPFERVIDYMREAAQVNIVVDESIRPVVRPVTLFAENMQLTNVFYWLLQRQKLDYRIRKGAIFISDAAGLKEAPVQEIHDIADLTLRIKDFTDIGQEPISVPMLGKNALNRLALDSRDDKEELERAREGESWAKFIRENVAPETWSGEGGVQQNTIAYRNGKLVITHQPEVQERIRELLASFRKARAIQVAILSRFIEISDDFLDDLGFTWGEITAGAITTPGIGRTTGSSWLRAAVAADSEVATGTEFASTQGIVVEVGILKAWQVQAVINAVRKHKKGNILTAPRVTCFNTQRAYLTVSTRRNYVRSYDSDGNPEIAQVNDGIIFQVQPWVSADRRYITLEVHPQVNKASETFRRFQFGATTSPLGSDGIDNDGDGEVDEADEGTAVQEVELPDVTVRVARTTVSVPDGGTLMIGGLAQAREAEGYATVPLLGDLPLIRHIFTSRRKIDVRSNLIILVTAHIIEQEED